METIALTPHRCSNCQHYQKRYRRTGKCILLTEKLQEYYGFTTPAQSKLLVNYKDKCNYYKE